MNFHALGTKKRSPDDGWEIGSTRLQLVPQTANFTTIVETPLFRTSIATYYFNTLFRTSAKKAFFPALVPKSTIVIG